MKAKTFGKAERESRAAPRSSLRKRFSDPRRHSRQRMIKPGKLYFGPQTPALDCLIGDMSMSGARVRVRPGTSVLDNLFLVHLSELAAYRAKVVWRRRDGNLGLAFDRSYDLEGAIAPELRVMREYCAALRD